MSYSIESNLLTVKEVSSFLKLSVLTIYKYIKQRKLEAIEFGGHYRIERAALINFVKRHRIGDNLNNSSISSEIQTDLNISDSNNKT